MLEKYYASIIEISAKQKDKISAPDEFVLFPAGWVEYQDYGSFLMDEISANQIISQIQNRSIDIVIDYEHASVFSEGEAPAAGWIKPEDIKFDETKGFVVKCNWTEKAKNYIESREYRYVSPVFDTGMDNRIIYLHSVALTNTPRTNKLEPLTAKNQKKGEQDMSFLDAAKKLLGMENETDEAKVLAALKTKLSEGEKQAKEGDQNDEKHRQMEAKYNALVEKFTGVAEALGVPNKDKTPEESLDEMKAVVASMKMAYVPKEEFQKLQDQLKEMEAKNLVASVVPENIAPAQREAYIKLAKEMPDVFSTLFSSDTAKVDQVPTESLNPKNTLPDNKFFTASEDARFGDQNVDTVEKAEEKLLATAENYQKDNKDLSLEDALKQACMDYPKLAQMVYAP